MFSTIWTSLSHIFGIVTKVESKLPAVTSVAKDLLGLAGAAFPEHNDVLTQEVAKISTDVSLAQSYVTVASSFVNSLKTTKTPVETISTSLRVLAAVKPQYAITLSAILPIIAADTALCEELVGLMGKTAPAVESVPVEQSN